MLGSTERETDRRTADLDASSVRPYGPSSAPAAAGMKRVPAMIMILFPPFHARTKLQLRLKRDKNHSALLTRVPISANHVIAAALLLLLPSFHGFVYSGERERVGQKPSGDCIAKSGSPRVRPSVRDERRRRGQAMSPFHTLQGLPCFWIAEFQHESMLIHLNGMQ